MEAKMRHIIINELPKYKERLSKLEVAIISLHSVHKDMTIISNLFKDELGYDGLDNDMYLTLIERITHYVKELKEHIKMLERVKNMINL